MHNLHSLCTVHRLCRWAAHNAHPFRGVCMKNCAQTPSAPLCMRPQPIVGASA